MRRKVSLILFVAFISLSVNTAFAGGDDIILLPLDSIEDIYGRSPVLEPIAMMDDGILTLEYPSPTTSEVVVTSVPAGTVVYTAQFNATTQVQINLASLPAGTYLLEVYAFDKWWWGEFVIEDDN